MPDHTASSSTRPARTATGVGGVLACLWGTALAVSIITAWVKLCPALPGRVVLGLLAAGFLLFSVARASNPEAAGSPRSCAHLLSPGMRRLYWAGYGLMASGVVLTAVAALKLW